MTRHVVRGIVFLGVTAVMGLGLARGQGPTIDSGLPSALGGTQSMLGAPPGGGAGGFSNTPGADQGTLGGRAGTSATRAPASITTPSGTANATTRQGIGRPEQLQNADLPVYGNLTFPNIIDMGPADGITLDAAIQKLVTENLYLRAASFELPQADADTLTASLRANPVFYADSQLVPYGTYSRARPGGQTQYDVNISYPLDISRKRKSRIASATRAKMVLDQQYRDAVRLQIDNLYTAYVDVLAARATLRAAEASLQGLDRMLVPVLEKFKQKAITEAEYLKVATSRELAEINRDSMDVQLRKNKITLSNLLNIPAEQATGLDLRSPLVDTAPAAPGGDELMNIAMESRPDLIGYRLGIERAEADVRLALANRYQDIYVLYQPYTLQDNQPNGLKSATSWALGVTVPIPLYNRNQGNIQRARLNVGQTQTQLAGQLRQVISDVQQAQIEYEVSKRSADRFETMIRPYTEKILISARQRYDLGQENVVTYLSAVNDYASVVKQYLDILVRHRRAMLDLNTAVGRRILP
jgi:cobalt-zinc-cadmium efflux system outer membrane protein